MKKVFCGILALVLAGAVHAADANAPVIVQDGKPNAQIVIAAENRPRMTTLAALELRAHIEEMSGARLPIVTTPSPEGGARIFVGRSPETDRLGVTAEGLKYGAYRMVTGPDWIVLLGDDFDFDPAHYRLPLSRNDMGRAAAEWDAAVKASGLTDAGWAFPFASAWKVFYDRSDFDDLLAEKYGADAPTLWTSGGNTVKGFWIHDGAGSLNAVCAFLREFGVRWYMPGPLGTVIPRMPTISAAPLDRTERPDFAARSWRFYYYASFSLEDVVWPMRVGMNSIYERSRHHILSHELVHIHGTDAMKKAHPEYYALVGGKRDTEHRGHGTACFSSEGLVKEAANFLRFQHDHYRVRMGSIWPGDGLKQCQCPECSKKSMPDLVWSFVERVAREVYNTHPNMQVVSGAYANYKELPQGIEKFSPNFVLSISNSGRARMTDPEHWAEYAKRVRAWAAKVAPGNLVRGENNRYHIWGGRVDGLRGAPISYPVIHPRAMARDLKFLKETGFYGEDGEQAQVRAGWKAIGLEHITLYVQSRFLWNAGLDVDEVLDEYCRNFYGPAAQKMKAVIDFAEENLAFKDTSRSGGRTNPMNVELSGALKLRDLLDEAKAAAGDTVYGERVQCVINDLQPRDDVIAKYKEIEAERAEARRNAPLALGVSGADLSKATAYPLRNNRGSAEVSAETHFKVGWADNALLLDIVCREPEMAKVVIAPDVFNGDYVAVSLATPMHSYYHIEISPDGTVVEGNPGRGWKSLAEISTDRGADFWRVRLRIPVVGANDFESDPLHRVGGEKPTAQNPWYFNVGRVRLAGEEREVQAFSPTGGSWHVPSKFGRLEIK